MLLQDLDITLVYSVVWNQLVQIMVFELLMLHENTDLIPSGDSNYLSLGKNYPTEGVTLVLIGIHVINKLY